MERVTGIEPAWPAWKAGALPLSYTREGRRLFRASRHFGYSKAGGLGLPVEHRLLGR